MRFTLVNNKRVEAKSRLEDCVLVVQNLFSLNVVQKEFGIGYTKVNCDNWWEPETEWHRQWKENYPADCQGVSSFDTKTGENHIADIHTTHNLVIEFQHSRIYPPRTLFKRTVL